MNSIEKYFSEIKELYNYQKESLDKILNGKNTLTIAPTGGGKSLIFQCAALELGGTTIVISPLIALMDEQVDYLKKKDIRALDINGDMPFAEQRVLLRNLKESNPQIIYVSPERLFNYFFRAALKHSGLNINLVVIDEAHCINQWGIDFRPDYGNIKPFIEFLRVNGCNPVTFALTATLGEKARKDILNEFTIAPDNEIMAQSIIRKELTLNFLKVNKEEDKLDTLKDFINKNQLKKVLVYLYSRKKCEELSSEIPGSEYFHSGLSIERKREVLENFKSNRIKIVFATTAFGMGINIPDIDGVVHYQIPFSVEEYYQHVGRGARDLKLVKECKCLLLYSDTNFDRREKRIISDALSKESLLEGFKHLGLENKACKKTYIRYEEIIRNDGSYGSIKLALIKSLFERYGICKLLGDIYGNPLSITFKQNTDLWNTVINGIGKRNQFLIAEKKTGLPLETIVDHVYEQELSGNITKLPALDRIIFLESKYDELPEMIIENIVTESKVVLEFRLKQQDQLWSLIKAQDPSAFIAQTLNVPT